MAPDPLFLIHRVRIVNLAARHQLPAVYPTRDYAESGGLIAYGPYTPDLYRRAATYVDKILKGAKPADLPVEQPTQVRTRHQPQDRQGPRPHHSAVALVARGSGHRVMDRRAFVSTVTLGLLAAPLAAEAQPAGKVWRSASSVSILPLGYDVDSSGRAPRTRVPGGQERPHRGALGRWAPRSVFRHSPPNWSRLNVDVIVDGRNTGARAAKTANK